MLEHMRASIGFITDNYLAKLQTEPYGEYKSLGMNAAIADGSEMGIVTQWPARMFGDTFWKHSVQNALVTSGHQVLDDDTRDHDSIECGRRREYKAARVTTVNGVARVMAGNPTRNASVRVELFVADGPTLDECGYYALDKRTLDRFCSSYRNGSGWALNVPVEDLRDPNGLGAWRMDADEYARYRTRTCRCKP